MAYDERLATLVRKQLIASDGFAEKKMFGGLCFLLHGNMACGLLGDSLIVRVGPEAYARALEEPGAGLFDFTGRPMKGWVQIAPEGWSGERLSNWIKQGVAYALSLPAK